jgi:outer membrane lipoprotein-sorting protein
MKIRTAFLHAGSLALFSVAVAAAIPRAQTPTPAEKQYKNIQVFKGSPASEILPSMNAITAALGVKCSFCHSHNDKGQWEFEKDTEAKDTARKMVIMMRKINDDNFDGRMQVTCATCHQGHAEPNRFAPLGQSAAPERAPAAEASNLPSADSVLDKYVQAIGGSAAVGKIRTLHMKADAQFDTTPAKIEIFAKAPSKLMNVMTFGPATYVRAFDGTVAWGRDAGGPVEDQSVSEVAANSPFAYIAPKDYFKGFRGVRKDTLDGKDVLVLNAQSPVNGIRQRLYFDASTGLLLRTWTATDTLVGAVPGTEDYSDYRDVDGVKIPFKVVDVNGEGTNTFTMSEIKANEDVPDSKFEKPVK